MQQAGGRGHVVDVLRFARGMAVATFVQAGLVKRAFGGGIAGHDVTSGCTVPVGRFGSRGEAARETSW